VSGQPSIAFETASNRLYQIEYKAALTTSNEWTAVPWSWTNSGDWNPPETKITPSGPVTSVLVPESTIATQGFFRVRTGE
jgi:hypothetical protein